MRVLVDIKSLIREAAETALTELEIEDINVDVVQHTASYDFNLAKWSIHFRKSIGEYFRVVLDTHQVHITYGPRNKETLTAEMIRLLQDPRNYMPL